MTGRSGGDSDAKVFSGGAEGNARGEAFGGPEHEVSVSTRREG
jgi:hypothetical protein